MAYLRKAEMQDINLLFNWANESLVRKNSFNSDLILYEDHKQWFKRILDDDLVLQYIMLEDKKPIGQIRLDLQNDAAIIGYSIAREYRGHGYGHIILKLILEEVKKNYPEIKTLIAKVKPDNVISKRLFENEGYEIKYNCYTFDINMN